MSDFTKPVLAFDSALGGCTAAILNGGEVHKRVIETEREQAAKLMPMIQGLMADAKVGFEDLGLIVTTTGPGSFTGLRISLSSACSLGLALNIPVQGVSTFEAMARTAVQDNKPCLVILETKRTDFYVQAYDAAGGATGEPSCMEKEELRDFIAQNDYVLCGDALERLGAIGENRKLLDPEILARIGLRHFLDNGQTAERPEPLYLRGADVSTSNKQQREIDNLPSRT